MSMTHTLGISRLAAASALVLSAAVLTALATPGVSAASTRRAAPGAGRAAATITGWTQVGSYLESTLSAGEGVATVTPPGSAASELYRGAASIPVGLAAQGWTHIGDPDSAGGYIIDAYQGPSSGTTKMYLLTTPSGTTYQYTHTLVPGELYNNSFGALTPDRQWMVSGEWGTMSHLQVYPAPGFSAAAGATGGPLALAGYIQLDHPVNDVQSCDFVAATELVCASDDSSGSLFSNAKPLLAVDLPGPLTGGTTTGHVVDLGSIPQHSLCSGSFEAEGTDYDPATGILRVEVIQPGVCEAATTVYEYHASGAG
jgi:hypothetical protein